MELARGPGIGGILAYHLRGRYSEKGACRLHVHVEEYSWP